MYPERPPQPSSQEIQVFNPVLEQTLPAMQHHMEAQEGEVFVV